MESVDGSKTWAGSNDAGDWTLAFLVLQATPAKLARDSWYCPIHHVVPCAVFGVGGEAIHASPSVERRNAQTRYHHSDDRILPPGYVLFLRAGLVAGLYPDPTHGLWLPTLALVPE